MEGLPEPEDISSRLNFKNVFSFTVQLLHVIVLHLMQCHLEKIKLHKQSFKVHQPSWKISILPVSKSGSHLQKHICFHCSHHSPLFQPPSKKHPILLYWQHCQDVSPYSWFFGFQSSQLTEDAGFWTGMEKGCLNALPFLFLQHLGKCTKNHPTEAKTENVAESRSGTTLPSRLPYCWLVWFKTWKTRS